MGHFRMARLGSAVAVGVLVAGVFAVPASAAGTGTVQGVLTTGTGTPIAGGVKLQFNNGVLGEPEATTYTLTDGGTLTVDEKQPATGAIAGHLTDAAGQPAPWAGIAVRSVDTSAFINGYTDDQGAYTIDALPGRYRLSFRWDSATQWAVQAATEEAATVITVTAGATTTVDDHKLPTGTAGGRLTASDGTPLAGVSVTLHRGGDNIGWATTDDDGAYSLGEVLAGDDYTVSYSVDGGADVYVPGTVDPAKARKFAIVPGRRTTIDDSRPVPSAVHGRLTAGDGSPKAGYQVTVALASNDNWVQLTTRTGDDGAWSVHGVFPGDYRVSFVGPDGGRTQWAYGKSTEDTATLVPIAAGSDVPVDDTWPAGATLVVNAVDATTGAPVTDYCIWVTVPGDGSGCAATGSQVTVTDLAAGAFNLQATPGENSYYLHSDFQPVTLTAGATTTVKVKLTLGGRVAFTAADHATGAAVNRGCATFELLGHGGLPDGYGDCTDATGRATSVSMAAGTYEMYAVAPAGYGDQWVGRTGGTGDQRAAARIAVKPGRTVKAPAVRFDKPGTITGSVTDATGKPLAGANVAWSAWGDAGPGWDTTTDCQGRYTISDLGPYAWPLLFGASGYPRQWSGHGGNRYRAETVTVVAGGSTTYNFTPVAGATLKGTVTAPAGATWRIHAFNAATGDQLSTFDSTDAGPGGSYELPVIGGQQVKVDWSWYVGEDSHRGWYDKATDIETATKVGVPPGGGTKTLNLTLS